MNAPKDVRENKVSSELDDWYYEGISCSNSGLEKQSVIKM